MTPLYCQLSIEYRQVPPRVSENSCVKNLDSMSVKVQISFKMLLIFTKTIYLEEQYVLRSTQNRQCINEMNTTCYIKYDVFNKIISDLDPLIKDGMDLH